VGARGPGPGQPRGPSTRRPGRGAVVAAVRAQARWPGPLVLVSSDSDCLPVPRSPGPGRASLDIRGTASGSLGSGYLRFPGRPGGISS
jgi:hypothetical protein